MKLRIWPAKTKEKRATVLAGLILLQAICALFFIGDVIEDFREDISIIPTCCLSPLPP